VAVARRTFGSVRANDTDRGVLRKLILLLIVALALVLVPVTSASSTIGGFRSPTRAAYCELQRVNYTPPYLYCWTPNDGFTLFLGSDGRPMKSYDIDNKWNYSGHGGLLRFGQNYWANAAYKQGVGAGRGVVLLRCASRTSGLTCRNRAGHGFWLGRFRGYQVF